MRTELSPGTVIELTCDDGAVRKFQIDQVIGNGANCIAYEAHRAEDIGPARNYRIKECYPYDAHIERLGTQLEWKNDSERSAAFTRLQNAHELIVELRNVEAVGNNVTAAELYEGNGTLYSVMEVNHAKTYDKDTGSDLHRILETIRVLTEVVGNLHEQGYLHLDIKPENFLVNHRPNTNIWLFDVDSLVSMRELESGEVQTVSYSQRWAAPEQLRGQLDKICPATDLYAIGAILFEKVMGRPVSNEDTGLFAEWNFVSRLFDEVNPKIKRILREIFQKTLSANMKRRYQNTADLIKVLKEACEVVAEGKPFVVSPELQISKQFIGRDTEMQLIHQAFTNDKNAVFLHGIGGIGKSSLAIAYANHYKSTYDVVLFCRYKNSLEDILYDIDIQNFEGTDREKYRLLKKLLDKHTLLIVDNFDVATDADPFLNRLLEFNARFLFTSRTDFRNVLLSNSEQIEVSELPYAQLEMLFSAISGIPIDSSDRQQTLKGLLKSVGYHTYITDLLARQIVASGWTLDTLSRKMSDGLNGFAAAEKVQTIKDGAAPKKTISDALRVLFDIAALNEQSRQVLRNLYLLCGFVGVTKESYKRFCVATLSVSEQHSDCGVLTWYRFWPKIPDSSSDIDTLNELCERGWIQKNVSIYVIHPLVAELIFADLSPNKDNCHKIYEYMDAVMKSFSCFDVSNRADELELKNHFDLLCAFLGHISYESSENRKIAREFLREFIEQYDVPIWWSRESEFERIITKLEVAVERLHTTDGETEAIYQELFEVYFDVFLSRVHLYQWEPENSEHKSKYECDVFEAYNTVVTAAKRLKGEARRKAEDQIYQDIKQKITRKFDRPLPRKFVNYYFDIHPEIIDELSAWDRMVYDMPLTQQDQEEIDQEARDFVAGLSLGVTKEKTDEEVAWDDHLEAWENRINEMYDVFQSSSDKLAYAKWLHEESGLEIFKVVACLLEFCDRVFTPVFGLGEYNCVHSIVDAGWTGIEPVMDYVEQLQLQNSWCAAYTTYSLYDDEILDTDRKGREHFLGTFKWRAALLILRENQEQFNHLLDKKGYQLRCDDSLFVTVSDPRIPALADVCWNAGKCHYILPYLLEALSDKERNDDFFDEREHISMFEKIYDFATKASCEVGEDFPLYKEYLDVAARFENRIDRITRKSYILKKDIEVSFPDN